MLPADSRLEYQCHLVYGSRVCEHYIPCSNVAFRSTRSHTKQYVYFTTHQKSSRKLLLYLQYLYYHTY